MSQDDLEGRFGIPLAAQGFRFLGAVRVMGDEEKFDSPVPLSLPNLVGAALDSQILVVALGPDMVADGRTDMLLVDTAAVNDHRLETSASPNFPGVTTRGTFAFLQPPGKIGYVRGRVVDAAGRPVEGALVLVAGGLGLNAMTNPRGEFTAGVPLKGSLRQVVNIIASDLKSGDVVGIHRELVEFVEHSPASGELGKPVSLAFRTPAPLLLPFKPPDMSYEEIMARWGEVTLQVRTIVGDDISLLEAQGYDVSRPRERYDRANAVFATRAYRDAWKEYFLAFQECLAIPETPPLVPYWYRQLPALPPVPTGAGAPGGEQHRTQVVHQARRIVWRAIRLMEQGESAGDDIDRVRRMTEQADSLLTAGRYDDAWGGYDQAFGAVPDRVKEIPELKEYEPPDPRLIPPPLKSE